MARDIRIREYCWDVEVDAKYYPVQGKKLCVYLDERCLETLSDEEQIAFLRDLKTKYGFSLIMLYPNHTRNELVSRAGWTIDEIIVNATDAPLSKVDYMRQYWTQEYASIQCEKQHLKPGDEGYDFLYTMYYESAPPFYGVFLDEPLHDDHWKNYPVYFSAFDILDIEVFLRTEARDEAEFFRKLCRGEYDKVYEDNQYIRFVLMSLYVHLCLDSKLIVSEYNAVHANFWRKLLKLLQDIPKTGPVGQLFNWLDSVVIGKYESEWGSKDQSVEWETLHDTGWDGGMQVLSLAKDSGEFSTLLQLANKLNIHTIIVFPQAYDNPHWRDCDGWKHKLKEFLDAAAANGFVTKISRKIRKCTTYEIPGCREGHRGLVGYDPFITEFG